MEPASQALAIDGGERVPRIGAHDQVLAVEIELPIQRPDVVPGGDQHRIAGRCRIDSLLDGRSLGRPPDDGGAGGWDRSESGGEECEDESGDIARGHGGTLLGRPSRVYT